MCLFLLIFPSFAFSAIYEIKWAISRRNIVHEATTTVNIDGSNPQQTITHSTVAKYPPELLPERLHSCSHAEDYQALLARGVILKRHHSIYQNAHGLCALAGTDRFLEGRLPGTCRTGLASHSIAQPGQPIGTATVDLLTHLHQAILLSSAVAVGQVMPVNMFSSFPTTKHDLSLAIAPVAFMPDTTPALSCISHASNTSSNPPVIEWTANGVKLTIKTYPVSSHQRVICPSCSFLITLTSAIHNNQPGFQLAIEIGEQQLQSQAAATEPVITLTAFIAEPVMEALTGRTRSQTEQLR